MISEKNLEGEIIEQPEEERKYEELMNALEQRLEEIDEETDNDAAKFLSPEEFEELVRLKSKGIKAEQKL